MLIKLHRLSDGAECYVDAWSIKEIRPQKPGICVAGNYYSDDAGKVAEAVNLARRLSQPPSESIAPVKIQDGTDLSMIPAAMLMGAAIFSTR